MRVGVKRSLLRVAAERQASKVQHCKGHNERKKKILGSFPAKVGSFNAFIMFMGELMHTILLVDDEDYFRERLSKAFADRGFIVHSAENYEEALQVIIKKKPARAVVDLKMPGKSGLDIIKDGLAIFPDMQIVVLTGYGSIATATEAIKLGALYYLPKPADVDDILKAFSNNQDHETSVEQDEFTPPSLARAEWEHINRVLSDCKGNISAAAKKLGIHRRTLQRKLYKYAPNK